MKKEKQYEFLKNVYFHIKRKIFGNAPRQKAYMKITFKSKEATFATFVS